MDPKDKTTTTAQPEPTPTTQPAAITLIDGNNAPKDELQAGTGSVESLFTRVIFVPVSGDVYARERDRRGKSSVTVGFSRKVADVQIEMAGTGIYTPGVISMVQGVAEKTAHLEMSVGVWNPDTKKSSILCADAATKDRFLAWKDAQCAAFLAFCETHKIDLTAPTVREHANTIGANILPTVAPAQ